MRIVNRVNQALHQQPLPEHEIALASELDTAHLNRIKNGRVLPGVGTALRLARVLGTDVETLFRLVPDGGQPPSSSSS